MKNFWQRRQEIARLGSFDSNVREAAMAIWLDRGAKSFPFLERALGGPPAIACGAAVALERMGSLTGVRSVLCRCYLEEWHLLQWPGSEPGPTLSVVWLPQECIGKALMGSLTRAARAREYAPALGELTIALSALRTLRNYSGVSPLPWWMRAFYFGNTRLHWISQSPALFLVENMAGYVRQEGVQGLKSEYPGAFPEAMAQAFQNPDRSVCATAIGAAQTFGYRGALPFLETIALDWRHPYTGMARRALEQIGGPNYPALTLIRSFERSVNEEEMLRPAQPIKTNNSEMLVLPRAVESNTLKRGEPRD